MLEERQKKFCDYYIETGNASESYQRAGYKAKGNVAEAAASRLLKNVKVIEYIRERNEQLGNSRIANMLEVKEFWSNVLRNKENEMKDRLKASEYIAKTNAAFVENVKHSGNVGVTIVDDLDD
jgi:phage terminase small subunit